MIRALIFSSLCCVYTLSAQQCIKPTTSDHAYSSALRGAVGGLPGTPNGSCTGPGDNAMPGTGVSLSGGSLYGECDEPYSTNGGTGVGWSTGYTSESFTAGSVCDNGGGICPIYGSFDVQSLSATMLVQNGAPNRDWSLCVGAGIQACLSLFKCDVGLTDSHDIGCDYKVVDVVNLSCPNTRVYDAPLDCCCVSNAGEGCGNNGFLDCNGNCTGQSGGCDPNMGNTCSTDGSGEACGARLCDGTCDTTDCSSGGGGGGVGDACGGCGTMEQYGHCDDPCCCGGGPGASDCGGCAEGAECRDVWGTPECIWMADPILIDLSGDGFLMTNAQQGVRFDFFRTGTPLQLSWTKAGARNGWLALDLNHDGKIDNGQELFGNAMPSPGPAGFRMGFKALAVHDTPAYGGNGDGVIDAKDAVYSRLLIWVDTNHNGVADAGEVISLKQAGIKSISVDYKESRYIDAYGNQFQYRSQVFWTDPKQNGKQHWAYDVVLVSPDLPSSAPQGGKSK